MHPTHSPEPIVGTLTGSDLICVALFLGVICLIMAVLVWNINRRNRGDS